MSALFQALNLYPESRFWRVKKSPTISNMAGGVATLILIIGMGVFAFSQLISVFQKSNMRVTYLSQNIQQNTSIFTQSLNASVRPFMIAVELNSDIEYHTNFGNSDKFQTCTAAHFQGMTEEDFYTYVLADGYRSMVCLPLQSNYTFKNSKSILNNNLNNDFYVVILCSSFGTCKSRSLSVLYWDYRLEASNNSVNFNPSLTQTSISFVQNGYAQNSRYITKNQLKQSNDIFTGSQFDSSVGYSLDKVENMQQFENGPGLYQLYYSLNNQDSTVEIRYYTILEALASVGGLFNIIFAFFFVVGWYSQSFSKQVIAHQYFGSKAAGSFHFFSFIKLKIYQLLHMLNFKKPWKESKIREKLSYTTTHLMDVIYLQRRIEFLQRAISVFLEEHHLKGIYLFQAMRRKEIDRSYQEHQLRNKVKYIVRKQKESQRNSKGEQTKRTMKEDLSAEKNDLQEDFVHKEDVYSDGEQSDCDWYQFQEEKDKDLISKESQEEIGKHLRKLVEESREGEKRSKTILQKIDREILTSLGGGSNLEALSTYRKKKERPPTIQMQDMTLEKSEKLQ